MPRRILNKAKELYVKLKENISTKSLVGSIIFAVSLWAYANLNERYSTIIQVPLVINLPKSKAIESQIPSEINVEVKGTGWHLFNLIYFNSNKACNIYLNNIDFASNDFNISRTTIIKSLENLYNVEAKEVIPEIIPIKTGIVKETYVDVIPNIIVNPAKDFISVGDVKLKPAKVLIKGNENLVKNLKQVFTEKIVLNDINRLTKVMVPIADSIKSKYKLNISQFEVTVNVQKMAEQVFYDVPIKLENVNYKQDSHLEPLTLTVTLRGGINQIENVTREMISAFIDLKQVSLDTEGIIIPKVIAPAGLEIIKLDPPYIFNYKKIYN